MSDTVYKPSGIKVQVLSIHDEGEYLMVRSNTSGKVFFAHKDQIESEEVKNNTTNETPLRSRRAKRKVAVVRPQVPTDNRINLNNLTPEGLTQCLPGVGIKTAKEIVDLRQSLPGERFTKLEQLKAIKRVDWDQVFESGDVYVE